MGSEFISALFAVGTTALRGRLRKVRTCYNLLDVQVLYMHCEGSYCYRAYSIRLRGKRKDCGYTTFKSPHYVLASQRFYPIKTTYI